MVSEMVSESDWAVLENVIEKSDVLAIDEIVYVIRGMIPQDERLAFPFPLQVADNKSLATIRFENGQYLRLFNIAPINEIALDHPVDREKELVEWWLSVVYGTKCPGAPDQIVK